jgi:hypothetical protein
LKKLDWRRVAGFRVVMSWPQAGYAPPPSAFVSLRARAAGMAGVLLIVAGVAAVGVAIGAQVHAPHPSPVAAGVLGPYGGQAHRPLQRSLPVAVDIPAIGVHSKLLHLGINSDGTIQVPSLNTQDGQAAWYKYSPTPGQAGTSLIEGHVDSYRGAAVFFRLGALHPGDSIDVRVPQIPFPGENHLRRDRLRGPAPDNVRRHFRLHDQELPQFHRGVRVSDLGPAHGAARLSRCPG